jgi:hypothetical protein
MPYPPTGRMREAVAALHWPLAMQRGRHLPHPWWYPMANELSAAFTGPSLGELGLLLVVVVVLHAIVVSVRQ